MVIRSSLGTLFYFYYLQCVGSKCHGTGFYLNVPEAPKHVILTAGHNLIDEYKRHTTNMTIIVPSQASKDNQSQRTEQKLDIAVKKCDIFICESFKHFPVDENEANDWGIILVPKESSTPFGFGFSISFATNPSYCYKPDLNLMTAGYRGGRDERLVVTSGKGRQISKEQVEYKITTYEGMSGSPVFLAHNGAETVIAIQ
jgi:V8-like Glu-specific endopeptidase